jgi:signal transduction histidine kinase
MGLGPRRDELTSLAATLDELLGRIDAALRHEQRFSAEVAHELRTPLSGLRAEAELAMRRPGLGEQARESFEAILASAERMSSSIDMLLLAARAPGAHGECDASAAIGEVIAAFQSAADAANVTLGVRPAVNGIRVGAEQEQVAQALAPLVDNAIGHAASRVVVSAGVLNGTVTLSVEDDGAGLPTNLDGDIFAAGVSGRSGAGLGLPLARRLARACDGDVVAVPASTGARFELRLPGGEHAIY